MVIPLSFPHSTACSSSLLLLGFAPAPPHHSLFSCVRVKRGKDKLHVELPWYLADFEFWRRRPPRPISALLDSRSRSLQHRACVKKELQRWYWIVGDNSGSNIISTEPPSSSWGQRHLSAVLRWFYRPPLWWWASRFIVLPSLTQLPWRHRFFALTQHFALVI